MEPRELRPLGVGEILDSAINICFRNLGTLIRIAAAIAVPIMIVTVALDHVAFAEPAPSAFDDLAQGVVGSYEQTVDNTTFDIVLAAEGILSTFGYLVIIGAAFFAVSELYLGRQPGAGRSLRQAAGRLHSLIWVSILFVLGVSLGLLALIVPGIWLLFSWAVAIPVLMLEDKRGTSALGRSFGLVRNNWWRVFGALLVGFIFIGLIQFLLDLAAVGLTAATEESKTGSILIVDSLLAVSTIITAPLQAAIVIVLYYDLRVRKEAFDVELLAAKLEDPGSSTPRPASGPAPPAPPAPPGREAPPPPAPPAPVA